MAAMLGLLGDMVFNSVLNKSPIMLFHFKESDSPKDFCLGFINIACSCF